MHVCDLSPGTKKSQLHPYFPELQEFLRVWLVGFLVLAAFYSKHQFLKSATTNLFIVLQHIKVKLQKKAFDRWAEDCRCCVVTHINAVHQRICGWLKDALSSRE